MVKIILIRKLDVIFMVKIMPIRQNECDIYRYSQFYCDIYGYSFLKSL